MNDLAVLDLGKAHMIAVDGNTDVVLLIQPLLSSQAGDVFQETTIGRLDELRTCLTPLEEAGAFELDDDVVVAGVAFGSLRVQVDLQSLFKPLHPCVAYFFLVDPLLAAAIDEVVALLGIGVHCCPSVFSSAASARAAQ